MLEIEKKGSKTQKLFRSYSSRLIKALSTIRSGRARAREEMFSVFMETDKELHVGAWKYWYLIYLNNPSELTIFESNKIKVQHEKMKLQNEEVMLRNVQNLD